jgi:SAM-dependent methyltransferase
MIQFLDATSSMSDSLPCPICRGSETFQFLTTESASGPYVLLHCRDCATKFYNPLPKTDYSAHTDSMHAVRAYVESIADIDGLTSNLLRVLDPHSGGKLLDIGCGFGFSIDVVRRTTNWQVVGVEPSTYGRIGERYLQVPIHNKFFNGPEDVDGETFQIIHASEVIEHILDPRDFLRAMDSCLAGDGIVVLTTPDADRVERELNRASLLALLTPGSHAILYSSQSLERVLKEAGFTHVVVENHANHLVAYASRKRFELRERAARHELMERYYKSALDAVEPFSFVATGLAARYYKLLASAGRYAEAEPVFRRIALVIPTDLEKINRLDELVERLPYCACGLLYFRAIHFLNAAGDYSMAAELFRKAFVIALKRIDLSPSIADEETHLLWHAKFHEALCHFHLRQKAPALAAMNAILQQAGGDPPRPDLPLPREREFHTRVHSLYEQIRELK